MCRFSEIKDSQWDKGLNAIVYKCLFVVYKCIYSVNIVHIYSDRIYNIVNDNDIQVPCGQCVDLYSEIWTHSEIKDSCYSL